MYVMFVFYLMRSFLLIHLHVILFSSLTENINVCFFSLRFVFLSLMHIGTVIIVFRDTEREKEGTIGKFDDRLC